MATGARAARSDVLRRPGLSREVIFTGALQVIDEIGVKVLTMRKLAQHLGVDPMAVYHYVPSKEELLDGVAELVVSRALAHGAVDAAGDWHEDLRDSAIAYCAAMLKHPHAMELLATRDRAHDVWWGHDEWTRSLLAQAGLSAQETRRWHQLISAYVNGFVESAGAWTEGVAEAAPSGGQRARRQVLASDFEWGLARLLDALIQASARN